MSGVDAFLLFYQRVFKNSAQLNDTLALFGIIYVGSLTLKLVLNVIHGFKVYLLPKVVSKDTWLRSLGSWAIVTGCAHGIGLGYAKGLAKRNINIILIDFDKVSLDRVATYFENKYKIKTIQIHVDLSQKDFTEKIEKIILSKDIGILINSVGISAEPQYIDKIPPDMVEKIINVNVRSTTLITKLVLPQMIKKNKGAIVNVSSSITMLSGILLAPYAATKAYIDKFTETLQVEYRNTGITIQCVNPGFVKTYGSVRSVGKVAKNTSVEGCQFSSVAIRTLGYTTHTCGHWNHGLQYFVFSLLPSTWLKGIFNHINIFVYRKKMSEVYVRDDYMYDDVDAMINSE